MGFSTIIDILGSVVIGGFLMVILWRIDDASVQNVYNNGEEVILQSNLTTVTTILENDFRKIGYCAKWEKIPDPSQAIISADTSSISFLTDIDNDGNVDTLTYSLGPTSELSSTPNPRDRFLYRKVNNQIPHEANLGVTQFRLIYFNALGDTIPFPISVPGEIATMEINVTVENSYGYDQKYSEAYWRQIRLAARNLRNR